MCWKWGGGLKGKPPSRFLLRNIVSVLYEVVRPGSARSSSYRSIGKWAASGGRGEGLAGETFIMVSLYGTLFRCCTRSSGHVRRSLLSIGPLLYKCSIRSLAWLCVLLLYLVATRWISSVILGMWRSIWSSWLLIYQGAFTTCLRNFDWNR